MKTLPGAPYVENAQTVVQTEPGDDGAEIDLNVRVLAITDAGLTLKLPSNPEPGHELRLLGATASALLDGNGNMIAAGGDTVALGTALDLTFFEGTWLPSVDVDADVDVFLQNVFSTTVGAQTQTVPNPPTVIRSVTITPLNPGVSKLRYKAFVALELGSISAVTFTIKDPANGVIVSATRSYPTVPLLLVDNVSIEWEAPTGIAGPRTVTLDMQTTVGTVQSGEVYLAVDEIN